MEEKELMKFAVYDHTDLLEPVEAKHIIDSLAIERANEFNWKQIQSNSDAFNKLLKEDRETWVKLYEVSKKSIIDPTNWGILVLTNKYTGKPDLRICRINSYTLNNATNEITSADVLIDTIQAKGYEINVNLKFKKIGTLTKATLNYSSISNEVNIKNDDFKNLHNFIVTFETIPLVIWKPNPSSRDDFSIQKEKAKSMEWVSRIIHDQMFQNMTKKETLFNEAGTGFEYDEENTKEFTEMIINKNGSLEPNYKADNVMYQPSSTNLKPYLDLYEWYKEQIADYSNAIKDDDSDSAQKTTSEVWNMNRSGSSQLELNKDQFENNLINLIKIIEKDYKSEIIYEVNLPFNTIGKAIFAAAKNDIREQTNGGNNYGK